MIFFFFILLDTLRGVPNIVFSVRVVCMCRTWSNKDTASGACPCFLCSVYHSRKTLWKSGIPLLNYFSVLTGNVIRLELEFTDDYNLNHQRTCWIFTDTAGHIINELAL